jgi:hypothetical protein
MFEQRIQRRVAGPIALLAAIAIAVGGGSTRLTTGSTALRGMPRPAAFQLDHLELVAVRAQASPAEVAR